MPELHYEPTTAARPVVVEEDGQTTRIIVSMPGIYAPVPQWISRTDLFALILAPVWLVGTLVVRACRRLPKPPQAVFEITPERFKVAIRDCESGALTQNDFPRSAVAEARASRYDKGLWLNVSGHVKDTILTDLSRETIDRIEAALTAALATSSGEK